MSSLRDPPYRPVLDTLNAPPRPAAAAGSAAPLRRLHYNEGAWPPSPKIAAAILSALGGINQYGHSYGGPLAAAIAHRTGMAAERVVIGNGSGELIQLASTAFIEPGRNVVVSAPTYPRLASGARVCGGSVRAVPVRADGSNDVEAMLAAVDDDTRLLWLASPNNPTGAASSVAEIVQLARAAPLTLVLAIDDAYGEFARAAGGIDTLQVVRDIERPWFLLRSFSKAYGLAGLRVGYGFTSSAAIAEAFHRVRMTFNVDALALAAAAAAYEDEDYMLMRVRECLAERERLRAQLERLGLRCLPSEANFLAFEAPVPAAAAVAGLHARGILVSEIKAPGYERHVRVTVGLAEDNAAFLAALAAELQK